MTEEKPVSPLAEIRATHMLCTHASSRNGINTHLAGCACGVEYEWYGREEAHAAHMDAVTVEHFTSREAAARREALLEAAEELDALPSYRSGRGFLYSHEIDFADGRDEEAERIADWLRVLAEPERDEESGR